MVDQFWVILDQFVYGLFSARNHYQLISTHEVCIPLDHLSTGVLRRWNISHACRSVTSGFNHRSMSNIDSVSSPPGPIWCCPFMRTNIIPATSSSGTSEQIYQLTIQYSFPLNPYGATYQEMAAAFVETLDIFLVCVKIRTIDS